LIYKITISAPLIYDQCPKHSTINFIDSQNWKAGRNYQRFFSPHIAVEQLQRRWFFNHLNFYWLQNQGAPLL